MLASLILGALLIQAPTPQPSQPPEIIRVQSNTLCTAIRERIGPSIAALLQNDASIREGSRLLHMITGDHGTPWLQMDKLHLENDVSRIVRNLDAIDQLLDAAVLPISPAEASDLQTIERLKSRLHAVADSQRAELNVLDGTLESEDMSELTAAGDPNKLNKIKSNMDRSAVSTSNLPDPADPNAFTTGKKRGHHANAENQQAPQRDLDAGPRGMTGDLAEDGILQTARTEADFTRVLQPLTSRCAPQGSPPKQR